MDRSVFSKNCAWCGQIQSGGQWIMERRLELPIYSHGICPDCVRRYFSQDRAPVRQGPVWEQERKAFLEEAERFWELDPEGGHGGDRRSGTE